MEACVEDFSEGLRDAFHYPKENANRYERRTASSIDASGNLWGTISYEDNGRRVVALKSVNPEGDTVYEEIIFRGSPSKPFLCAVPNGGIAAVWVELQDEVWQILYGEKRNEEECMSRCSIYRGKNPCLNPALCFVGQRPCVAWAGREMVTDRFAIWSSRHDGERWIPPATISGGSGHNFRPVLRSIGETLFFAWDNGLDGRQHIEICEIDTVAGSRRDYSIIRESERLICPSLAMDGGSISIACIAIVDVLDSELGISDHRTGVVFAQIRNGALAVSPAWAADINEGLLGIKSYVPYFGIRRRCNLTRGKVGEIWLTWEMRFESERCEPERDDELRGLSKDGMSFEHYGYLAGRKLSDGRWGPAMILHRGGTCYSVAADAHGRIGATYLEQSDVFILPELRQEWLDEEESVVLESKRDGEQRWNAPQARIARGYRYSTMMDDKELRLYWGDTHVHSNFSPDAEGEQDELILYGRDIAGLDFMAMVDNDYYPHAGLMPMEWEIQQELAAAFTEADEFVVFPGFEFTFHDRNISPNFNHRYVLYPRRGELFSRLDARTRTLEDLNDVLGGCDAIMVAHHPNWKLCGAAVDSYVEICSSWRVSMEEKNFIIDHLRNGEKFAFLGSSDTHRACPGLGGALTGIYSGKLDPDSLFEGYGKRRTIATQGLRIAIDFRIDDLFIGDSGTVGRSPYMRLTVRSPVDIDYIQICRDGRVLKQYDNTGKTFSIESFESEANPGRHFYYIRVKAMGDPSFNEENSEKNQASGPFVRHGRFPFNFARALGPFAWTSPIWAHIE